MNKKAIFTPLLLVVTIVILGMLAFTILKLDKYYEENINLGAISAQIIKTYSEGEKAQLFLEQAADYSKEISLNAINKNSGYKKECQGITPKWNDCSSLNIENDFESLLAENIVTYLKNYQSYSNINYQSTGFYSSIYQINKDYTNLINNLEIESIKKENNNLIITSKPVTYSIEGDTQELPKKYTTLFIVKTEYPDFSIYYKIYNTLKTCKISEKDMCQTTVKRINPEIKTKFISENMLEISYKDILITFDISRPLQPLGNLFTA